jgi:hypothetical protein
MQINYDNCRKYLKYLLRSHPFKGKPSLPWIGIEMPLHSNAALASFRGLGEEEVYREQAKAEFITRKLKYKTRRYLTSGGKTYVSDGIPGKHSPFAKNLIEALRSRGGRNSILTLPELYTYVERLKIQPQFGEFGDNAPGSDFIFIVN